MTASTSAAMIPAAAPNDRRTARNSTKTEATPMSASGKRMLHELRPKIRTDRPITMVDSGGLSTVMKFEASMEPKNQAVQSLEAATAAAE